MELFNAHNQWANRPDDEKFDSLEAMYDATRAYAQSAAEAVVPWSSLRAEAVGDDLVVVGDSGAPARLTHYAFGQMASKIKAPASYLRTLAPTLAAQNLNYGLKRADTEGSDAKLLFHTNGSLVLRAATSEKYSRIWNWEVIGRLIEFCQSTDMVPAEATIRQFNDDKALYASDHDMFAFVMSPDRVIFDPVKQPLRRGLIVVNSEVGDKSLQLLKFYFRDICGNHIIWGAEQVFELRYTHVGNIDERWTSGLAEARRYIDGSATLDQAAFDKVTVPIAGTKDEVLDTLFGKKSIGLSRKALDASYDAVVPDEDGDPRSPWGIAQGITRFSQQSKYAEDRQSLDRAAGKILQINF